MVFRNSDVEILYGGRYGRHGTDIARLGAGRQRNRRFPPSQVRFVWVFGAGIFVAATVLGVAGGTCAREGVGHVKLGSRTRVRPLGGMEG